MKRIYVTMGQAGCGHSIVPDTALGSEEGIVCVTGKGGTYVRSWTSFGCSRCDKNAEKELKAYVDKLEDTV